MVWHALQDCALPLGFVDIKVCAVGPGASTGASRINV
jgi:hypothetical protein